MTETKTEEMRDLVVKIPVTGDFQFALRCHDHECARIHADGTTSIDMDTIRTMASEALAHITANTADQNVDLTQCIAMLMASAYEQGRASAPTHEVAF